MVSNREGVLREGRLSKARDGTLGQGPRARCDVGGDLMGRAKRAPGESTVADR
jgi:hypothetical protein